MNRRWYNDCFCGSGKVGNELVRQKQLVYFLDRVLGPRGDLCSRKILSGIARDASDKKRVFIPLPIVCLVSPACEGQ